MEKHFIDCDEEDCYYVIPLNNAVTGRIIVYIPEKEELEIRKQAENLGLSASAFIRSQLKQKSN